MTLEERQKQRINYIHAIVQSAKFSDSNLKHSTFPQILLPVGKSFNEKQQELIILHLTNIYLGWHGGTAGIVATS